MSNDKPSSESNHSPTEQPGDKEIIEAITRAQFGTREQSDHIERHMAEYFTRWHTYKDKFTHLEWYHIFLDFYDSLPILSEVSTLRSKQSELVAEIKELERHKKELALCLEQANQLIRRYEGIEREQSAELEQLRSERDKMREALEESLGVVVTVMQVMDDDEYQSINATRVGNTYLKKVAALTTTPKP